MSIRSFIHGVTWKNPVVNAFVHAADPVDYVVRRMNKRTYLPRFSIRVRSNGVRQDIGGSGFVRVGRIIANLLQEHAMLIPDSKVLEIGCGCGRNALALSDVLSNGNYTGMDIERVALEAARNNNFLRSKQFQFDFLDIRSDAYNPDGKHLASEYVLPYADHSFDIVFLISVFTHMLTDEILNYSQQIARVLKPGGRCFLTAYLLDQKMTIQFPFKAQEHSFANESIPEIAVAYDSAFLTHAFAPNKMPMSTGPLWGTIHGGISETELDQDIIIFIKH